MVRIVSRKWTAAHIGRLVVLIDAGSSAASAAILLKRSISVVQNKARSLGKPFPMVASARRSALEAGDRQNRAR
jgi:gamma-glutamyltranspeptidase